jgi:hypothetical protein
VAARPLARRARQAEDPDRRGHRDLWRLGDCRGHADHPPDDHDTAFAISTIFLFNLVAVLLFPLLGH